MDRGENDHDAKDIGAKDPAVRLASQKPTGNICLEPTRVNIGRPYSPATSQLYVIALLEDDPENPEPGSKSFLIRFLSPSAKDWHLKLSQNRNAFTQGGRVDPAFRFVCACVGMLKEIF